MRLNSSLVLVLLAGVSNALPASQNSADDELSNEPFNSPEIQESMKQLEALTKWAHDKTNAVLEAKNKSNPGICTKDKLLIRKEWGALSNPERKAYTDAVLCLTKKDNKTPRSEVPGARNRHDDFVVTHMKATPFIHFAGPFLGWHRHFMFAYEQTLRNECGYKGALPYWDFPKTAITGLKNSPVFDGSEFSISGDGVPTGAGGAFVVSDKEPRIVLPAGNGGGCLASGPFKGLQINLGPVHLGLMNGSTIGNGNGFAYNPRCVSRDLTNFSVVRHANATGIIKNILNEQTIADFQRVMQGGPGELGVHGGSHFALGGDPGRDPPTAPADPIFFLLHSMIDKIWWMWQQLDIEKRQSPDALSGTNTARNDPPSANTTRDYLIDFGYSFDHKIKIGEVMSTVEGPYCYSYE